MKKFLLVLALIAVFLTGCKFPAKYHEGDDRAWIEEQVQNGALTRAEADKLLKQENPGK